MFTDPLDVKGETAMWRGVVYYALVDASRRKDFSYFRTADAKHVLSLAGIEPEWLRRKLDAVVPAAPTARHSASRAQATKEVKMAEDMVEGIVGIAAPSPPPSVFLRERRLARNPRVPIVLPPDPPPPPTPFEQLLPLIRHFYVQQDTIRDFRDLRHATRKIIPRFGFQGCRQPAIVEKLRAMNESELADWLERLPG